MDWRRWRDTWLGDPQVRAWIGRWPIGRRIAARHARRLFTLVAGFAESQMLAAAVELGVFERLRGAPRPWSGVTDLPPAGAVALRQALIAAGLIEERGGSVALTIDGLVVASDAGLRAMIAHNRLLYADLADPVAMLRGKGAGRVASFWPYRGGGDAAGYSALMDASNNMVTEALVDDPAFRDARQVMDVGGGHGALLLALRRRWPRLALTLVDLPPVAAELDLAAERIAVHAVAAGAPLPTGADIAVLMRVLHDQDDASAAALLARVAAALPAGGRLVVVEPMAMTGRDPQTAYFAAYFAAMGSGRLRTPEEIRVLMRQAGFAVTKARAAGPLVRVIIGEKLSTAIDV